MIPVDKVYNLTNDLLSKNNGVSLTPEEFDRYAEVASDGLFDSYRGADNPNATKVVYGHNRTLDGRLKNHRVPEYALSLDLLGYGSYPEDWVQTLSVRTIDYQPIRPIDEDRAAVAISQDPYTKPSEDEMLYEEFDNRIKVHPAGDNTVVLNYLRKPVKAVYAYTTVNRRAVFDPINSVNFDWDKGQLGELTHRILQLVGVSMDKGQIVQYSEAKQAQE